MGSTSARVIAALILGLGLCRLSKAETPTKPDQLSMDRHAGLVEVFPPATMQQAPAAVALIDRLINHHMLMLRSPALITQVMQSGDLNNMGWVKDKPEASVDRLLGALRVHAIPDTNMIEITVDPALVGDDGPKVIETVVNQHLENEKQISINEGLVRSVMLNNLKNRYQFRKDDLSRDLREKTVRLSVDGMGMPGRFSAKEQELKNLLDMKFEVQRKFLEATSDDAKKPLIDQQKALDERIDAAKADLGALTNATNQYLVLKDDEQANRKELRSINQQLEQIQQQGNVDLLTLRWVAHPFH